MTGAPFAPWALQGESLVALVGRRGRQVPVPPGILPMPGPALLAATRYTSSPVGPYVELMLAVPARVGLRLGWSVTLAITNHQDARIGGRLNWGFPSELGSLSWACRDDERELVWDERDLRVCGRPRSFAVPLAVPVRSLQQRGDGPVVVHGRVWGRVGRARVSVHVMPGDDLAWTEGPHPGVLVSGLNHVVREARHPMGLSATLQAPARAQEPAMRETGRAARAVG